MTPISREWEQYSMDNFRIKTLRLPDDIIVVAPIGSLDSVTAPELEKTIQKFIDTEAHNYIFDLSKLETLTSAGIGFFTKLNGVVSDKHGGIAIINPVASVKETMDIFGLFRYVSLADSLDSALRIISQKKTGQTRRPNL
ncbi:MAG: STAS domain-containing protein [Candidatus Brocadiia bacterium]